MMMVKQNGDDGDGGDADDDDDDDDDDADHEDDGDADDDGDDDDDDDDDADDDALVSVGGTLSSYSPARPYVPNAPPARITFSMAITHGRSPSQCSQHGGP